MRIKVDFSEFFNDERKLSVVNVNTKESATVQDVLHKIIRMFKLTPTTPKRRGNVSNERLEYGLFEEEFYIPPEETSTVLEDIGILRLKSLSNIQTETPEGKKKKHKKIKAEEEEEVQPPESDDGAVGRKRRSKRHKVKVEEYSKEKKNKRRKEDVESDVEGEKEEDDDDGDSKKTRRHSLKKSRRSAPTVDADEVKKPKRKGRQPAESDEVNENNSPKKCKREVHQDSTSVTSAEELEDISSKEKKKSKRKESKFDVTSVKIEAEGIQSGPNNAAEARNKKCTRRSVIEDVKAPTVLKSVKVEKEEEKRSQEKEISTSNVIHVESDKGSESSFSGSSGSDETVDAGHVIGARGLADSVSGEHNVTKTKRKRKRKHSKKKKGTLNMPEDVGVASQSNAFKIGEHTRMSTNPGARNNPSMNTRQKNINVSTSSDRFHVFFPSEEEEEVTSVTNSGDGKDIEILGQTSGPAKKHYSPCTVTQSSDKDLNSQSVACKQTIIDIEGEDSSHADPQNTGLSGGATDGIRRRYPQKSRVSFDDLSNLHRMCDLKNLTIVSVSSKKRTVTSVPVELACPVLHTSRGPPCPVPSRNEANEYTRRIFNNLLSLENRGEPLILRTSRQIDLDVEEDVDCMGITNSRFSVKMDAQSNLPFTQNTFMEGLAADSHDVLCMPSTSGYMETNGTPVDVPGPSTRATRKGAPRSFRSLGEMLSNLRNPQDPEEPDELQVITGNEDILLDIPSSPEEIKQEKEDAASTNGGDDDDITSTIGEVEKQEFIVPDELSSLMGAADVSQNCDPIDPLQIEDVEARALMEEMLAEGLKQDMLLEIMGTSIDEDTHFTKYPLMKILPKAGEFIAIKVLSLDESLRPVHSNYIKVQVVEVSGMMIKLKKIPDNIKKKELKVKVEDGVEEVDLTFEEEVDLTEVDLTEDDQSDLLDLDWRDILEPRLLFP